VLRRSPPGPEADVFSFGRLLFFLSTGLEPLAGFGRPMIITMSMSSTTLPQMPWPDGSILAAQCRTVADRCMLHQRSDRPTMADVHKDLATWPDLLVSKDDHFNLFRQKPQSAIPISRETSSGRKGSSWHDDFAMARQAVGVSKRPGPKKETHQKKITKIHVDDQGQHGSHIATPAMYKQQNSGEQRTHPQTSTNSAAGAQDLAVNGLVATPRDTIWTTLLSTMLQWNYPVQKDACCVYHAALEVLISNARDMSTRPCNTDFFPPNCVQCPACGILTIMESEDANPWLTCELCGCKEKHAK